MMPLPFWHTSADDGRVCADCRADVRDDGGDGAVLLDDFSKDGDEFDFDVPDHRGDVHGAGGGEVFCGDVLSEARRRRRWRSKVGVLSPFSAAFALPLNVAEDDTHASGDADAVNSDLRVFFGFVGWSILYNTVLVLADDAVVSGAVARGGLRAGSMTLAAVSTSAVTIAAKRAVDGAMAGCAITD